MSQKVVTTCDRCGAPCSGNVYASLWDNGDETKPYKHTRLDGCSQEHLWACIAKAFGISVDGNAQGLLASKNESIEDLKRHAATLTVQANQYKAERDHVEETCRMHSARVAEQDNLLIDYAEKQAVAQRYILDLEKQLTAANDRIIRGDMARRKPETVQDYVDASKIEDYAEMAYAAWRELPSTKRDYQKTMTWHKLSGAERNEWRAIVEPVVERVRAEKNESVLQTLKARVADITEENNGFRAEPLLDKTLVLLAIEDAIASITDTTKPIKPGEAMAEGNSDREVKSYTIPIACGDCVGTSALLSGQMCTDCRGRGYRQ